MIISGLAFIFMCMLKETYAPALLRKKAKLRRKEQDDHRYWSRYDNKIKFWPLLKVNLSRPFVMVFTEPVSTLSERLSPLLFLLNLMTFVGAKKADSLFWRLLPQVLELQMRLEVAILTPRGVDLVCLPLMPHI